MAIPAGETTTTDHASSTSAGSRRPTSTTSLVDASTTTSLSPSDIESSSTMSSSDDSTALTTSTSPTPLSSTSVAATSTSIQWGPAITASPLAGSESSSSGDVDPSHASSHSGFSRRAERITISTTVIGAILLLALLVYIVFRRRKGATYSGSAHWRRHPPSTIILDSPREAHLTALPIYRESRYSVRSSKHASLASFPRSLRRPAPVAPVPPEVAQTFHKQNPYVKTSWKTTTQSPPTPRTPLREAHSFLHDASPPTPVKEPGKARVTESRPGPMSQLTEQSRGGTPKSTMTISVRERPASVAEELAQTPPATPHSQQHLQDRWSWTNSQAPATPRMYAPSLRSSISSLPRFRTIKSWVKGQSTRIEEERPITGQSVHRKPTLKNKASLPKLAPPVTRRLSKSRPQNDRKTSLRSLIAPDAGIKPIGPTSPRLEEQRPGTGRSIADVQRALSDGSIA